MAIALKVTESWVPGWAASFGTVYQIGLGLGQTFVNPLYQQHEAGNEVLFAPLNPAHAMLISLMDEYWAGFQPTTAPQAMP